MLNSKNKIIRDFTYPEIKDTDYVFGAQLVGKVIRENGDWRNYLPPQEEQRRNGVESSSCFIEASQHTLATILEEEFGLVDNNFSARFNLNFASASPQGGDPLKGAQTFRDYGLIPDLLLPFSDQIKSWEDFNSFIGGDKDECIKEGKEWRKVWNPKYGIVVRREMDVQTKYQRLKESLKSSPCPVSLYGEISGDTYIKKPEGVSDTHLVELVYIDENNIPYIWDTYPPFLKKLEPNYDFDFGMSWSMEKEEITQKKISIIQKLINLYQQLINLLKKNPSKEIMDNEVKTESISTPEPAKPKLTGKTEIDVTKGLPDEVIEFLLWAEVRGTIKDHDAYARGDNGTAYGCLQIRNLYLQDVNRYTKMNYQLAELLGNFRLSRWVTEQYMKMWLNPARLKRLPTVEEICRTHNGGVNGRNKTSTLAYWNSIKEKFGL